MNFIDKSKNQPRQIPRDVSDYHVDEMAQILYEYGYKGEYILGNIFPGVAESPGNVPTLIQEISSFLKRNREKISETSPERLHYARSALRRSYFLRDALFSDALRKELKKKYEIEAETKKKMFRGDREYLFIDISATSEKHPKVDVDGIVRKFREIDNNIHWDNIVAMGEALNRLGSCKS
ncbi:uncharacterized protein LDX57_007167 [Aspergillus melleus]|uniref:uncharacterized protein n=1 Tax=Aspergillus melleus TaxID=138277 RepID=UPI001E8EE47D|nr:uncharacterized protein LDX57_007167 [Aspergillus melleus]KAH8429505.1 hypothetical protein LDX57_007167 [Aspergillus melleus]